MPVYHQVSELSPRLASVLIAEVDQLPEFSMFYGPRGSAGDLRFDSLQQILFVTGSVPDHSSKPASVPVSSELSAPPEPGPDRRFLELILRIASHGCSMRAWAFVQDHAGLALPLPLNMLWADMMRESPHMQNLCRV